MFNCISRTICSISECDCRMAISLSTLLVTLEIPRSLKSEDSSNMEEVDELDDCAFSTIKEACTLYIKVAKYR